MSSSLGKSESQRALDRFHQSRSRTHTLSESGLISDVLSKMEHVFHADRIDGCVEVLTPGAAPHLPNTFPQGKFLAPEPGIYRRPPLSLDFEHLPSRPSPITAEDASMCPQAALSKSLPLSEKTLSHWEETAIRGLEAVSVLDSFFLTQMRVPH